MINERIPFLKNKVRDLPLLPGVYIMKDNKGEIIYIGKAKKLKNRVSSYFRNVEKHPPKVYKMVSHVNDFEYIVTDSEFEALVLECSLIKLHMPKYNILLKDDKGYHYIKVSDEPYPRITSEKQKSESGTYFGPYVSSFVAKQTVDEIIKAFGLPVCSRRFPQDIRKERPCLYYHIKQCIAPCRGTISQQEYNEIISQAVMCIKDGSRSSIQYLERMMNDAAENLEFEKAAVLRDRIAALKKVTESQKVILQGEKDLDAVGFAQRGDALCAVVLKFRKSRLTDKEDFVFDETEDVDEAKSDFLLRFYDQGREIPPQIVLPKFSCDFSLIQKYLTEKRGKKAVLQTATRGEMQKIVTMACENAAQKLSEENKMSVREVSGLQELGNALGMTKPPGYVELYDISNFGETTVVAGMAVFENGQPLKSAYKKFTIRDVVGQNDYGSMQEVLSRRIRRYDEEKESGKGFGRKPDLIFLDGGEGHVRAIKAVVAGTSFADVPIYGLVKNNRHRTRAISSEGGEIALNPTCEGFRMMTRMQDEVHRFAISFSRKQHTKNSLGSALTQIPEIGQTRAKALLKHFGSMRAIKEATEEQLVQAPGITQKAAQEVYRYYHS